MRASAVLLGLALLAAAPQSFEIRGMKHPAISPDGRRLAFSWHGDLWICPSSGGEAERLTDDPADEQKPAWSPDGARIAYSSDRAGNRDLFVVDAAGGAARQLTFHSSDDDAPAWSPDGKWIAFQSNRDSTLDLALNNNVWDVWKMPAGGGTAVRVTRFRGENPAWSPDGRWIAYDRYASGYSDGEHNIFVIAPDGTGLPRELAAGAEDSRRPVFKGQTLYFAHEANGIQLSSFRNVWRTTLAGGALVQVTGHQGDQVTWPTTSEKAETLVYEYDFDLYSIALRQALPRPKRLAISTRHRYPETSTARTFGGGFRTPAWSPEGSRIAFICRGDLWISALDGSAPRALSQGVEEDRDPAWSPDGKEVVFFSGRWGTPGHLLAAALADGATRRLTSEEGFYSSPRVSPDRGRILFTRAQAGETDLWILEPWRGQARPFAAERDVEESFGSFSPDGKSVAYLAAREGRTDVVLRPLEGGEARVLKTPSTTKKGLAWSPDGKKLAYAARAQDGAWSARVLAVEGAEERTMAPGAQAVAWSPDSTMLLCEIEPRGVAGQDLQTLSIFDTQSDQRVPVALRVTRDVPRREEMLSLLLQVWGSYFGNYYDPFFHGTDMPALRDRYAPLAAECRTRPELYELVNDMIREMRSSHIHLRPAPVRNSVVTGALALDLERAGDGTLVVKRVEPGGPASRAGIREGEAVVGITGKDLGPDGDLDRFLTSESSAGVPEVSLEIRGASGETRPVAVKGLERTALRELRYANSISARKKRVRERSGGRLAYHHLRMMVPQEVQRLKDALEKEFPEAEGLVLDERDGVGGLAHRPLCALLDSTAADRLNRAPACWTRSRNGTTQPDRYGSGPAGGRSAGKSWDKPVILIQNEISRSDKEIFPYTFRHLGIGYLVGMPTAGGVIGGSEWAMADGSRITVSVQGWFTAEGRNMEGWGVPPDYRVPETHEDLAAGRDPQLEKAIEVLLAQMDGRLAAPRKPGLEKADGQPGK
jgi:Tol biopolymer transport system component/C-terminal processing protease CtpA/Prc